MENDFIKLFNAEKKITQERWRESHVKLLILMFFITTFIELAMGIILPNAGLRDYSYKDYFIHYVVLPDLLYLCIVAIVTICNRLKFIPHSVKNYIVSIGFSIMCIAVCAMHDYFASIYAVGMISISLTIMYCSFTLSLSTTVFIIIGEILVALFCHWDPSVTKNELYFAYAFMSIGLLTIATVISTVIIRLEDKRLIYLSKRQFKIIQLREENSIDPLTKLHNRRALRQFIDDEKNPITYVMSDIDHFKSVNDTFGHEKGDEILLKLAEILNKHSSQKISTFRFGGDEFLITFTDTPVMEIESICLEIHEEFKKCLPKEILEVGCALSIGVASYKTGESPHDSIQRADKALYSVKGDSPIKVKVV